MYNIQWGDTSYPKSFQRFDLGVSFQRFVYILRIHILLTFLGHTETYINACRALSKRPEKLRLGTPWMLISTLSCKWVYVRSALFKKSSPCEIMHFYCCVYVLHLQLFFFGLSLYMLYNDQFICLIRNKFLTN